MKSLRKLGMAAATIAMGCCGLSDRVARAQAGGSGDEREVIQANRDLLSALAQSDGAAVARLLDADFTWINAAGESWDRAQVLKKLPKPANSTVEPQVREYGQAAVVRANLDTMQVMRVWVKRSSGWKALLYQEVKLSGPSQPAANPGNQTVECENPCKTIPFQPETDAEKGAITSWQEVMRAMAENDADAYAPLIADEFTATDTHHSAVLNKAERLEQIRKQKKNGTKRAPPELVSARMFDFGDAVMMIARERRPGAKGYFNTRMWVKRGGLWQMVFSFNTRIERGPETGAAGTQ